MLTVDLQGMGMLPCLQPTFFAASSAKVAPFLPLAEVPLGSELDYGRKAVRLGKNVRDGLVVPEGIVLNTHFVGDLLDGNITQEQLRQRLNEIISSLEAQPEIAKKGLKLGDKNNPLIISVRSGGAKGMAGVLPTIPGVGLNGQTVKALGRQFKKKGIGDMRDALSIYLKFLIQCGIHIRGLPRKELIRFRAPDGLSMTQLKNRIKEVRKLIKELSDLKVPRMPDRIQDQLVEVVRRVADGWNSPVASDFRRRYDIDERPTTALIFQRMVFGRLKGSFAAVAYTRSPRTGEKKIFGGYLDRGSGDHVMTGWGGVELSRIRGIWMYHPNAAKQLEHMAASVEKAENWPQELELTYQRTGLERGILYCLQSRPLSPMTPMVGLRIALDMHREGVLTPEMAMEHVNGDELTRSLSHPTFVRPEDLSERIVLEGKRFGLGIARGKIIYDLDRLLKEPIPKNQDKKVWIMVISSEIAERYWGEMNQRCTGYVVLQGHFPGAHFYQRAKALGIPVIHGAPPRGRARKRSDLLPAEGTDVSLNAMHDDGYLALGHLDYNYDREIIKFVEGGITLEDIRGDRARRDAEMLQYFWRMCFSVRSKQKGEIETEVAEDLLKKENLQVDSILMAILNREWGEEEINDYDDQPRYKLTERAITFIELLYEKDPTRLVSVIQDSCIGNHRFTVTFFEALPYKLKVDFLNRYVAYAREHNKVPGVGVNALTRMVFDMKISSDELVSFLSRVKYPTLRFILEESEQLYTHEYRKSYENIVDRFPGVDESYVSSILRRLPESTLDQLLSDREIEHSARIAFAKRIRREFPDK